MLFTGFTQDDCEYVTYVSRFLCTLCNKLAYLKDSNAALDSDIFYTQ